MDSSPEIIFVDDSRTARKLARKLLKDKYSVHTCVDAEEAWSMIRVMPTIKIIFTDIHMKGMNGIDLLKSVRGYDNQRISNLPVIMITGASDSEESMREVFELGATDFIAKPFKKMDLISRAYSYIKLNDQVNSLEQQLGIDKLSGLYDENSMKQHASKFLAFSRRYGTPFSVAHLDIKRFDTVTERYGDNVASQIISAISKKMRDTIRDGDVASRIAASRFVVLLPACSCMKARISVNRLMSQIESIRFKINGSELHIKLLAGISSTDINGSDVELDQIQSQAKQSLAVAIQNNSESIVLFDEPTEDADTTIRVEKKSRNHSLITAFEHILEGRYQYVTPEQRHKIEHKISQFLEHCAQGQQMDTQHAE